MYILGHVNLDIHNVLGKLEVNYADLAVREMRSLFVGYKEVMSKIVEIANNCECFNWKRCM